MERQGNASSDDIPLVLAREGTHGPVVYATNRAGRLSGISMGSRVVDMRAICPEMQVEYADVAGDAAALQRLMLWVRRWCPWSVTDGADGLILDTTGSDHLMAGEAAMLVEMETGLSLLGLTSQLAVAPTWGAAWGLARYGAVRSVCPEGGVAQHMAALPVASLRLDTDTLLLLQRLGLKTVGQLADVPRLSLTRRFAKTELARNPLMRLDQAMGVLAEPVASVDAPPTFWVQARLPEPIFDPTHYLPGLCEDLCCALAKAGSGCRRLYLTVYRTDGEVSSLSVATSHPSRDPDHLRRLFNDRLEKINPGFGFDLITLEAGAVEPIDVVQTRLDGQTENDLALPRLIDRLTAKFGAKAVKVPVLKDSHVPERAEGWRPALNGVGHDRAAIVRSRPLRMLDPAEEVRVLYAVPEGPPAQFIWRRQTHRVARYQGPERIAPEWWKDRPGTRLRDYFRVENHEGQRFWLYREGLHEDGRGGDPRWFVQGMFE